MNYNPLKKLIAMQKQGQAIGIYSACSANAYVIEAALRRGKQDNSCVLIESTANQCDQNGGYTGMTPLDFKNFVLSIAKSIEFDVQKLILGGDHLGPLTWSHLEEKEAMENATILIQHYVLAGFTKIHIDTSMRLKDDDSAICLSNQTIARRGAYLAKVAEQAYQELLLKNPSAIAPVYIVGSEVPTPGGATGEEPQGIQITKVDDFKTTVATFETLFIEEGLQDAWDRVISVVVQPGVEENDNGCVPYNRKEALELTQAINDYPNLVFEGHSTDYQTKYALRELVEDGIAILKVGPALTFAMREALFALASIETELFSQEDIQPSNFKVILEKEMLKNTGYWHNHYHGNELQLRLKRKFSFSDRCRYYIPMPAVDQAISTLIQNLKNTGIPLSLLSQYMPIQYNKVREGILDNDPEMLLMDRITNTIDEYLYATKQQELI